MPSAVDIEVGKEYLEELDLSMEVLFLGLNGMAVGVEEDHKDQPCQVDASCVHRKVECHFLVAGDTDFVADVVDVEDTFGVLNDWLACCLKRGRLQRHFH